ncbi:MAG: PQQ-binding-like beta-propeller repeat protein [Acidobacteria bacterium]|nr:PQQ-binding-like beta-propeller repeat protein [Acidobacteriota bacterium]
MLRRTGVAIVALLALPALAPPPQLTGEDWPQFRGPERTGRSSEIGLFENWDAGTPLQERWRVPLGPGYSGISIVDGHAVTLFGTDGGEYLGAFDTSDGARLWQLRLGDLFRDGMGDGPRSTPLIETGRVYALSTAGRLVAADLETGRPLWQVDLVDTYGARQPTWGFAVSPVMVDGQLLIEAGGRSAGVVALDPENGTELWRALGDPPGYSTPIEAEVHGQRQVIFFTAHRAVALAPEDGTELWSYPWRTSYDVNAASPIFIAPDQVLIASGYDVGGSLLRIPATGSDEQVERVWHSDGLKNVYSSSVVVDGYIYGFDNGTLVSHELATGERMWRQRGFQVGSLIFADGHLVVLGERGTLALVRATPGGYQEIARQAVFDSKTWTPPSLSRHTLYVRDEHELVALELSSSD